MGLAVLFSDTGSTPDNLLKGGHALNRLIQNNQLGHFAVCSGRKQFRSRCNHWIRTGYGNEVIQLGFAVHIRTGNSYAIIGILLNHIGIVIDKGDSHTLSMVFGSTEHDGFLHSVGAFQILRDFSGNLINAVLENDGVIIVPVVVNSVFNDIAENIGLPLVWSPAVSDVGCDIDDLKRGKEAVLNALF